MDDVSEIPSTGCNTLYSNSILYNYSNGIRKTYINVGGKWYFTASSNYYNIPDSVNCIDVSDLSTNSSMVPVFYFIALFLALVVWFLWWSVFRRLFKWRIK